MNLVIGEIGDLRGSTHLRSISAIASFLSCRLWIPRTQSHLLHCRLWLLGWVLSIVGRWWRIAYFGRRHPWDSACLFLPCLWKDKWTLVIESRLSRCSCNQARPAKTLGNWSDHFTFCWWSGRYSPRLLLWCFDLCKLQSSHLWAFPNLRCQFYRCLRNQRCAWARPPPLVGWNAWPQLNRWPWWSCPPYCRRRCGWRPNWKLNFRTLIRVYHWTKYLWEVHQRWDDHFDLFKGI